ncbi:MAG: efflux RND transporter periplasmic adaptor subunit [Rubrivivax sp.]|nr:efflux RND transporter periplasmic adaptor subunit [Rubrivivax sp.]
MHAALSRRALFAALVCAAALALAACSRPAPPPEPIRAVRTLTVSADSASGVREYAAEVRPRTESRLGFRVAGKMLERRAELGQQVRAGEVLARLDAADLKLGQDAALAAGRAAQTNFELAAAEFKRYQELRAQGFISGLELERRQAALKAQQAQRDQALAQAGVQGNQAGYATLTAPAAGVITGVEADVGAVLSAGATVLRLAHDGPRDAVFAVPEDQLTGMRARLGRPGALMVRPWNAGAVLPATVREVAAAADPVTRTYLVKADLGKAAVQLGQTATVLADLPRREGVVRLPLSAVMQQQGQTAVWVLDPARMTVQVQPVVVAGADGNTVVVAAGLSPGQVVVTAGVHVLTPGQQVKYYTPPGTTTPAAVAHSPAASR